MSKSIKKFDQQPPTVKTGFFDYIKAAFNRKTKIAGLEQLPLNHLFLATAALMGIITPGIWILALLVETTYLLVMASNEKFQNVVRGKRLLALKEAWDEKQSQILQHFDSTSHQRYDKLVENCTSILKLSGKSESDPVRDLRISGLNKLVWMYLKLLSSRIRIESIVSETSKEEIEKEIGTISTKITNEPETSPLIRSLQGTLEIQQHRLENFSRAEESKKVIDAELDRIEKQVILLKEEASISSDPELISTRLDNVMDSLSGTNRWMLEQKELFCFLEESSMPDEFIYKPVKKKRRG